ncbi:MAG: AAA family ATPase [Pirellulales bacterium]|nr:AAA family ATPase [Pirellulales bacterium]
MTTSAKNGKPRRADRPPRVSSEILDSAPPSDVQAERQLLASIMLDPTRLDEVSTLIRRDSFHDGRHGILWNHFENMPAEAASDSTLLIRWLTSAGDLEACGGVKFIAEIAQAEYTAANARHYAGIVAELAARRAIRRRAEGLIQLAQNPTVPIADLRAELAATGEIPSVGEPPAFAKMLSSAELVALDTRPKFLIQNVLVEGMPAIIGGKSKAMKTSIMLDMAVSLGSGRPFLNSFTVAEKMPVAVWSGESGEATIRAKAISIAESKGVFLQDTPTFWNFALPKLSRDDHLDIMGGIITKNRIAVSFVDPLYLALLNAQTASQAGNLFAMGNALEGLSRLSQELKTTIVLLHHFRKTPADTDEPCSLEMLSQSGVGEWARGWILLQRQNPFTGDGKHELLMRTGSSVGFGGLYSVAVDEGVMGEDFTGRKWEVSVSNAGDFREIAKQREQFRRDEHKKKREAENLEADRQEIATAAVKLNRPESKTGLRELVACGHTRFNRAFASLVADGTFQEAEIEKPNGQKYPAWGLREEQ